jgi:prepilin-type N-terminal cleavage/methylation domain-containing protein
VAHQDSATIQAKWSRTGRRVTASSSQLRGSSGVTLVELLLAVAVLSIAMLALAAGLLDHLRGIRQEGRVTAANQAAVSIFEEVREELVERPADYDAGGTYSAEMSMAGVDYTGTYELKPKQIDALGELTPVPSGQKPHVFLVDLTVTWPDGNARNYSTMVRRVP